MGRTLEAEDRLELATENSIRRLCREHGITAAKYFELSDLNSPWTARPMSYVTFKRAMSGLLITEDHQDMLTFSLLAVRQELNRSKALPIAKTLPADVASLIELWLDDPDILPRRELSTLRGIVRRALARNKQH